MDLEGQFAEHTSEDKWVFLLGRIVVEAVALDAALRRVHVVLRDSQETHAALTDREVRDALLTAPESWSAAMRECTDRLVARDIDDPTREAISAALRDAGDAWQERNRYMHDLLVDSIDLDDQPPPRLSTAPVGKMTAIGCASHARNTHPSM